MPAPETAENKQPLDKLSGLVERVTFHSETNGYAVLRLKVRGERDLVTVIGHTPSVTPGEYASALGRWIMDKEYGRSSSVSTRPPRFRGLRSTSAPAW